MPSLQPVILCALAELLISLAVGMPLAWRLGVARPVALALAPIVGWAVFNSLALPVLSVVGFTRVTIALACGAALLAGIAALLHRFARKPEQAGRIEISLGAIGAAALLAIVPAVAVWPKYIAGGVVLSAAMFDHSKAAIIDEIVRSGVPPANPLFAESGPRLVYYYLWHFSAAIPAALFRASGWEADAALTWFTAFASLGLMIGLAAMLAKGRLASLVVVLLSLAASLKPLLRLILPAGFLARALSPDPWPQSWIFQASWAPQHVASAGCAIVAVLILSRLAWSRDRLLAPLLGVIVAAGFESSAWIGGVIFAASALPVGAACLIAAEDNRMRLALVLKAAAAVVVMVAIAAPFLRDEFVAAAARHAGAPISFRPFPVLGDIVPAAIRPALNLPAYWVILAALQFPAIYFAGIWAIIEFLADGKIAAAEKRLVTGFALLGGASFIVPSLFASTIANNDLGWRGVLPGILVLTISASAGLTRWLARAPRLAFAAGAFWVLGVPNGLQIASENVAGVPAASAPALARAPELWAAVRRHSAPDERVADNPDFLADAVRWPVNISWALLANRRSCYAGWNLARAFVPLPEATIDRINRQFERVFAGSGTAADVHRLAAGFDCRVVVVQPSDGAWRHDPFATSPDFRLVEENADKWRIYRAVDGGGGK